MATGSGLGTELAMDGYESHYTVYIDNAYIYVLHERTDSLWCTGVTAARAQITPWLLKLEIMPVRCVPHMHTISYQYNVYTYVRTVRTV